MSLQLETKRKSVDERVIGVRRRSGPDFSASFLELRELVREACRREARWEAKLVAGIVTTLAFCAAEPAEARALTLNARRAEFGSRNPEQVVISYFVDRLGSVAPRGARTPISSDESVVEAIALVVRGHLLCETERELPGRAPDLVCLAMLPYADLDEASRWARSAGERGR